MNRRVLIAAIAAAATVAQAMSAQDPVFRASVHAVSIYPLVIGADGRYEGGAIAPLVC